MFTVNNLSSHTNTPTNQQWLCGTQPLRCLQCSKGSKLTYTKKAKHFLVLVSDAHWSGDVNDRKSATVFTSRSTDMAQHSAGVSGSRPQLLFLQKENNRGWQQHFTKHCK